MARCAATDANTGKRCRARAAAGERYCSRHRESPGGGLYDDCFEEDLRAALERALASGLDQETALLRVLIRRALLEGRPATQVAYLVSTLSQLLKTQHVLTGKAGKQLDEHLARALDAIALEMNAAF